MTKVSLVRKKSFFKKVKSVLSGTLYSSKQEGGDASLVGAQRIRERINKKIFFTPADYLELHGDIRRSRKDPVEHYIRHGRAERRRTVKPSTIAKMLGSIEADYESEKEKFLLEFENAQQFKDTDSFGQIAIYYHSRGNYYMYPLARCLQYVFRAAGVECLLLDERSGVTENIKYPIILAPHEFFVLDLPQEFRAAEFLQRTILFTTEQLLLPWFMESLPEIFLARAVIDINFHTSVALRRSGIRSIHVLPALDTELKSEILMQLDVTQPFLASIPDVEGKIYQIGRLANRPYDLTFAGYKTPEREKFFESNSDYLKTKKTCFLYRKQPATPEPPPTKPLEKFALNIALASLSKCTLNIHRNGTRYFEWERMIVQGACSGAAVVTNTCLRNPFFTENVHYFQTTTRNVDKLVRWILDTAEGSAQAQLGVDKAWRVMQEQVTPRRQGLYLLSFLKSL